MAVFKQLVTFSKVIRNYFRAYGGWYSLFNSPIFVLSLFITLLNYANWIEPNWVDRTFSMIPSMLGFSLGTYAILFSLMTGRLKRTLKLVKNDRDCSYLDEINATFFHFIFVQTISLVWAFLYDGTFVLDTFEWLAIRYNYMSSLFVYVASIGSFIGHFLLIYSFLLILAAALAIYRIASITDPADI